MVSHLSRSFKGIWELPPFSLSFWCAIQSENPPRRGHYGELRKIPHCRPSATAKAISHFWKDRFYSVDTKGAGHTSRSLLVCLFTQRLIDFRNITFRKRNVGFGIRKNGFAVIICVPKGSACRSDINGLLFFALFQPAFIYTELIVDRTCIIIDCHS